LRAGGGADSRHLTPLIKGYILMKKICLTGVVAALMSLFMVMPAAAAGNWAQIVQKARGQTVDWFMYGGFPAANSYVNGYVIPEVKKRFDITLRQVPVQDIAEIVSRLLVEKQAGKTTGGEADLLWINGENFRTAKARHLLFGPFADLLPNAAWVDTSHDSVKNDFGEPVDGFESPWGSAQVVMIYDSKKISSPPHSMAALIDWIRAHPGRFTYPAPPDFTGSVFIRHVFYYTSGGAAKWQGPFDRARFEPAAKGCYDLLQDIAPYLWQKGKTYPESPMRLAQLFADGEIDFAMSYHPAEASKMIHDGLYPDTVRTFVFDEGTIANTHFVAIPFNSADKEGAMVVANFLLSPEAQLKKADPAIWGDLPAISPARLDATWRKRFQSLPRGVATLSDAQLQTHRLPEPPSEILIRLENGWQEHVLKKR
jgi:putative spermidine/putrescine transport system substrate-binding protein